MPCFIDRIGVERECFLLKDNEVVEPALFDLPFDEFGFLVELRSKPCDSAKALIQNIVKITENAKVKAASQGCQLQFIHQRQLPPTWINSLSIKYHYDKLPDLTANIHPGVSSSHASGLHSEIHSPLSVKGTAGMHIHFSRHDSTGRRLQLPIWTIIRRMDEAFHDEVLQTDRLLGEFELKRHGFEYRSLPCTVDVERAVNVSFEVLHSC